MAGSSNGSNLLAGIRMKIEVQGNSRGWWHQINPIDRATRSTFHVYLVGKSTIGKRS